MCVRWKHASCCKLPAVSATRQRQARAPLLLTHAELGCTSKVETSRSKWLPGSTAQLPSLFLSGVSDGESAPAAPARGATRAASTTKAGVRRIRPIVELESVDVGLCMRWSLPNDGRSPGIRDVNHAFKFIYTVRDCSFHGKHQVGHWHSFCTKRDCEMDGELALWARKDGAWASTEANNINKATVAAIWLRVIASWGPLLSTPIQTCR